MKGIVRSLRPKPTFFYKNYPATWKFFYQLFVHMKYGQGGSFPLPNTYNYVPVCIGSSNVMYST